MSTEKTDAGRPKRATKPSARLLNENNIESSHHVLPHDPTQTPQHSPAVTSNLAPVSTLSTATSSPLPTSSPPTPSLTPSSVDSSGSGATSGSDDSSSSSVGEPEASEPESDNTDTGPRPSRKCSIVIPDSDNEDEPEIVEISSPQPSTSSTSPPVAKRPRIEDSNARDSDGITKSTGEKTYLNSESPTADVNHFFKKVPVPGKDGEWKRECQPCVHGLGCPKNPNAMSNNASTLRRHMESKHKKAYTTWCKKNNFLTMLPKDTLERRKQQEEAEKRKLLQTQVDGHFPEAERREVEEPPKPYSDGLFRKAAIEWLVQTNQVRQSFFS
ncbi:hypothetical protein CPC08DRAFT_766255 [Agrocybe pediades]|nr:hypothetical protein CPC08DRAFT_766255 [Agrocybe pediades]